MPMYSLLKYSSNFSETTRRLWLYSKDKANYCGADLDNNNKFESFEYKAKLLGNTNADGANAILKNRAIVASSKYLSNFQRLLKLS